MKKLLLADDSITIQKVVRLSFAGEDIEVSTADNGDSAIEAVERIRPDIVLADVYMPGRSGLAVCEYIKSTAHLAHIPVILLVGIFEPFDQGEASKVHYDRVLTKPFETLQLLQMVQSFLASPVPETAMDLDSRPEVPLEHSESDSSKPAETPSAFFVEATPEFEESAKVVPEPQPESAQNNLLEWTVCVPGAGIIEEDSILELDDLVPELPPSGQARMEVPSAMPLQDIADAPLGAVEAVPGDLDKAEGDIPAEERIQSVDSDSRENPSLSEAAIEDIVRRVVRRLSDQVVRDIAWEVVPEMAESAIRDALLKQPGLLR